MLRLSGNKNNIEFVKTITLLRNRVFYPGFSVKIRTLNKIYRKIFVIFIDIHPFRCYYCFVNKDYIKTSRIILRIWLKSFYQATVNSLTTRVCDIERVFLSLFPSYTFRQAPVTGAFSIGAVLKRG